MSARATTRKNLFGFGRKPAPQTRKRSSGLTVSTASAQARAAGYKGTYSFSDWLEMKRLDQRGEPVVRALGQAYRDGAEKRERDERGKEKAREAKQEKAREKQERKTEAKGAFAFSGTPDEKKLAAAFKRGLSLKEALQENPGLRRLNPAEYRGHTIVLERGAYHVATMPRRGNNEYGWRYIESAKEWIDRQLKRNPSKFDRCVKSVQAKGGAANAYAVCTAAGTRNNPTKTLTLRETHHFTPEYGSGMTSRAPGSKVKVSWSPGIGYATAYVPQGNQMFTSAIPGSEGPGTFKNWPKEWNVNPARKNPSVGGVEFHLGNDGVVVWSANWDQLYRWAEKKQYGFSYRSGGPGTYGHTDVVYHKRNPTDSAAQAFEEFHGYEPTEVIKVTREVHHHKHLAAAGDLVGLEVKPISKGNIRKIEGLGNAVLAFNEAKNQLFIEGGDQRMSPAELRKFGITDEHELQTLGKLVGVGYFTDKKHLGSEGGEAVYSHRFRTTNENGIHITVTIARYPDLIYRVLDEQFEISGGSYEILREGIDK
jgi:hypothetical protein